MAAPAGDDYEFSAVCSRGVEPLLAAELREVLDTERVREDRGAVRFRGKLELGYRACMHSRLASRILVLVGVREAWGAPGLLRASRSIAWGAHFSPDETFAVDFVGRDEDLRDTRFSGRVVKDGIVDRLRDETGCRPSVDPSAPDVLVHAHLRDREVAFSIELGGSLHQRTAGRGRAPGKATLKENLAAAVLRAADWPRLAAAGVPLLDPMCGTGTLLIEAASMARERAPGLDRTGWGFNRWHGHQPRLWRRVRLEAEERAAAAADRPLAIYGSDNHADSLFAAKDNARRGSVPLLLKQCGLEDVQPPPGARDDVPRGIVVANPPYGVRLGDDPESVRALYKSMGDILRRRFLGWHAWILAGPGLAGAFGLKTSRRMPLYNGPLDCRLVQIEVSTEPPRKPGPRERPAD